MLRTRFFLLVAILVFCVGLDRAAAQRVTERAGVSPPKTVRSSTTPRPSQAPAAAARPAPSQVKPTGASATPSRSATPVRSATPSRTTAPRVSPSAGLRTSRSSAPVSSGVQASGRPSAAPQSSGSPNAAPGYLGGSRPTFTYKVNKDFLPPTNGSGGGGETAAAPAPDLGRAARLHGSVDGDDQGGGQGDDHGGDDGGGHHGDDDDDDHHGCHDDDDPVFIYCFDFWYPWWYLPWCDCWSPVYWTYCGYDTLYWRHYWNSRRDVVVIETVYDYDLDRYSPSIYMPPALAIDAQSLSIEYLDEGARLFRDGRYLDALRQFRLATLADLDFAVPKFAYAHALFTLGLYDSAAFEIARGLELMPEWTDVGGDLKLMYGAPEDFDAQLQALVDHLRLFSADETALLTLGYVAYFTGDLYLAEKAFTKLKGSYTPANEFAAGHFLAAIARIKDVLAKEGRETAADDGLSLDDVLR